MMKATANVKRWNEHEKYYFWWWWNQFNVQETVPIKWSTSTTEQRDIWVMTTVTRQTVCASDRRLLSMVKWYQKLNETRKTFSVFNDPKEAPTPPLSAVNLADDSPWAHTKVEWNCWADLSSPTVFFFVLAWLFSTIIFRFIFSITFFLIESDISWQTNIICFSGLLMSC